MEENRNKEINTNYKNKYIKTNSKDSNNLTRSKQMFDEKGGNYKKSKAHSEKRRYNFIFATTIITMTVFFTFYSFIAILLVSGGMFDKRTYLDVWDKNHYLSYSNDDRLKVIAQSILAPSSLNSQPWKIELSKENNSEFLVFVDVSRINLYLDNFAREAIVSIGAFLEYVSISSTGIGLESNIELFPEGEIDEANLLTSLDKTPIAKVTVQNSQTTADKYYDYLFKSYTDRTEYKPIKVNNYQTNIISIAKTSNDNIIEVINDDARISKYLDLFNESQTIVINDPQTVKSRINIFRINEREKNKFRFGLSQSSTGEKGLLLYLKQGAITLFPQLVNPESFKQQTFKGDNISTSTTNTLVMLKTPDNTRKSQIEAGRNYVRLMFTFSELGLSSQPMSSALLDYKNTKDIVNQVQSEFCSGTEKLQIVFRVGVSDYKPSNSMRIKVDDILFER